MKIGTLLTATLAMVAGCAAPVDNSGRLPAAATALETLREQGFVGSVLVACDDRIVLHHDVGLTSGPGADATIRYEVASVSKWITAIAVLKLAESGAVSLDDSIDNFLPQSPPDKSGVTLFHLLTHQSGLRQTYAAEGQSNADEAAAAILAQDLSFTPGADFAYSNDNYSLLAIIIEKAAGVPYKAFLDTAIMEPLALDPIAFWPDPIRDGEVFPPLLEPRDAPKEALDWGFLGGHGARLSVQEIHALLSASQSGALLSRESFDQLYQPHVVRPSGTGVGMGWYTNTDKQGRKLGSTRGSDSSGGNAVVYTVGDDGLIIIAATNNGPAEDDGPGWSRQARDKMIDIFAATGDQRGFCSSKS